MALSDEEYELWARYLRGQDSEARDFLFLKYAPWARRIASQVFARLRVPQLEWSDFVQNATVGLLEAMSRFDPDRGLDFMAYAKRRVQGSAFNGVRAFMTGVDLATGPGRFQERLENLPSPPPGSDLLDVLIDSVAHLGLAYLLESAAPNTAEDLQNEMEQSQLGKVLLDALETLADRERTVLTAHYIHHVPFLEIARQMRLTKGRISQIHKAGLAQLRGSLANKREDLVSYF